MSYKWCAVPLCRNTTVKTPEKLFVSVPRNAQKRKKWLFLARRNPKEISSSSVIYFCEDHFNMEKDMVNYIQHKMGFSQRIKLTEGALPSKFFCQQDKVTPTVYPILDPWLTLRSLASVKRCPKKQSKTMQSAYAECENDDQSMFKEDESSLREVENLPLEFQDQEILNSEGTFRTISIEIVKTDHIDDEHEPSVTEETNKDVMTYSCTELMSVQEDIKCMVKAKLTEDKDEPTVTIKEKTNEDVIKYSCTEPISVQEVMKYDDIIAEIRELETSVRIADRKLYRGWEAIKDSKDPEAYESLLDEVKNKQKTLNCMLQLIENRQALLLREQENEAEDDAVIALPNRRTQDTRRCFKRRKRPHESKSDHKTQVGPKQVTLYITGSSAVDEEASTRSSTELPSMELSQGPTPNIMFFTTNLT